MPSRSSSNVHPENAAFRRGQLVAVDVDGTSRPGQIDYAFWGSEGDSYIIRFLDSKPSPEGQVDEYGHYWAEASELADLPTDQRLALVGAPRLPGLEVNGGHEWGG